MIKQKTDNTPKLKCPWCIPGIDNCHCSQDEIQITKNRMNNKDYNAGLDVAASIVEEVIGETAEGETILCGIESSKKDVESPYCEKCDSCGETGCCPPIMCEAVKCKYGEINIKDYRCFQDQWSVMYDALKNITNAKSYFLAQELAKNALNEVDKL
jgi:hypothetical protein